MDNSLLMLNRINTDIATMEDTKEGMKGTTTEATVSTTTINKHSNRLTIKENRWFPIMQQISTLTTRIITVKEPPMGLMRTWAHLSRTKHIM